MKTIEYSTTLMAQQGLIYDDAVFELGIPKLAERRESLKIIFRVDTFSNERINGFFEEKNTCHSKH